MAKKSPVKKKDKSFEETLWEAANKLRGSVEPSEYKHIVLSLIFLKFINEMFEKQRQKLIDDGYGAHIDKVTGYTKENVFYLPEECRWSYIKKNSKQDNIAKIIDDALLDIEKANKTLKGALPNKYFVSKDLDVSKLASLIDVINNIDTLENPHEDVVGRVYEYFLSKFAIAEGKGKGEFYTPKSIVNLIAELIEPYKGKIYDPCCGSGGMFVQSMKFIENHKGNKKDVSVYGQEYTSTTYKLAKMNLAIRGISANLGAAAKDTFANDQHDGLKADFIMANPPFNQKGWRASDELVDDHRWDGYETPPSSNANYGWILHMVSKLSENGVAGFVLSNGALSDEGVEQKIRKKLIQDDLVEAIILLPRKLFYTTDIGVTLWILNKNKNSRTVVDDSHERNYRDRRGEVLFIDMRRCGIPFEKKYVDLTPNELAQAVETYHNWQQVGYLTSYSDIPEYCYSAKFEEIERNDFSLVLNKYVEFQFSTDSYDFDGHLAALQTKVDEILEREKAQKAEMFKNFKESGYELQA